MSFTIDVTLLAGEIYSQIPGVNWGNRALATESGTLHLSYCPCGLVVHNWVKTSPACPLSLQQNGHRCDQTERVERKKNLSEVCQYILIFCLAEKQSLDTLPHCLENNFTPLQYDVEAHTPHRLRRGNWSLNGDFRQMGDITTKENKTCLQIEEGKNHHHKMRPNKQLKIPGQIGMQSWNKIPDWMSALWCKNTPSPPVQIRIQPTTLE